MKDFVPSRDELMITLNNLLGTNYNWSRLNKLDLFRLTEAIKKVKRL